MQLIEYLFKPWLSSKQISVEYNYRYGHNYIKIILYNLSSYFMPPLLHTLYTCPEKGLGNSSIEKLNVV